MVALVAALGGFHVPQQGVHLGFGQTPVGPHRGMTSHGRQNFIARALDDAAGLVLRQFCQHRAGQGHAVGVGQRGRHRAQGQAGGGQRRQVEAEREQGPAMGFGGGHFECGGGEGVGNQQRLARDTGSTCAVAVCGLAFQALVHDALVRGMHVDNDQAVGVLGQDVGATELGERAAERPVDRLVGGVVGRSGRDGSGGSDRSVCLEAGRTERRHGLACEQRAGE